MKNLILILVAVTVTSCGDDNYHIIEQAEASPSSEFSLSRENVGHGVKRLENDEVICYKIKNSLECFLK
jgi:hypothetical protein